MAKPYHFTAWPGQKITILAGKKKEWFRHCAAVAGMKKREFAIMAKPAADSAAGAVIKKVVPAASEGCRENKKVIYLFIINLTLC